MSDSTIVELLTLRQTNGIKDVSHTELSEAENI